MILIEISDETGLTHYEVLTLTLEDLNGLDEKQVAAKVRKAAKKEKGMYENAAQKGDKEAQEKLTRINVAEGVLKKKADREQYDREMAAGKGSALEALRPQKVAPPFFWDRQVRFRIIERLMRDQGLARPLPLTFDREPPRQPRAP
jgi:curved DNA-binding protein CbpA